MLYFVHCGEQESAWCNCWSDFVTYKWTVCSLAQLMLLTSLEHMYINFCLKWTALNMPSSLIALVDRCNRIYSGLIEEYDNCHFLSRIARSMKKVCACQWVSNRVTEWVSVSHIASWRLHGWHCFTDVHHESRLTRNMFNCFLVKMRDVGKTGRKCKIKVIVSEEYVWCKTCEK